MTVRLPRIKASEIIRVLERLGFRLVRQSGSHRIYRDAAGKRVTVPYHSSQTLHPKVLQSILRDAGLKQEDLLKEL